MAEPSYEELKARVAELEKKGTGLHSGELQFKVGEKGGVSVYGLGRFPVTLYYEQWIRLLDTGEKLRTFLETNPYPALRTAHPIHFDDHRRSILAPRQISHLALVAIMRIAKLSSASRTDQFPISSLAPHP